MTNRMRGPRILFFALAVVVVVLVLFPIVALADNCGSLTDCWATGLGAALGAVGLAGLAGLAGTGAGAAGSEGNWEWGPAQGDGATPPPPPDPAQQARDEAQRAEQDKHIKELQHLVSKSNPSHSVNNCVKEAEAVDKSLGDGKSRQVGNGMGETDDKIASRYHSHWIDNFSPNQTSDLLKSEGNGARGIVEVAGTDPTTGAPAGHVFNAVNINGTVYYVDGQSGKVSTNIGDVQEGGTPNDSTHFGFLPTHPPR